MIKEKKTTKYIYVKFMLLNEIYKEKALSELFLAGKLPLV